MSWPFYPLPNLTYHTLALLTPFSAFFEQVEYNPAEPAACNDLVLDIHIGRKLYFGGSCCHIILLDSSSPATILKIASSGHTVSATLLYVSSLHLQKLNIYNIYWFIVSLPFLDHKNIILLKQKYCLLLYHLCLK